MFKRQLAVLLSAAMVFTAAAPAAVLADEESTTSVSESEIPEEPAEETKAEDIAAPSETPDETEAVEEETSEEEKEETETVEKEETESVEETETEEEEKPAEPVVKAVLSKDEKKISITATGIDPEATSVVFPTWSAANNQDDIEWAAGTKQNDGSWTAEIILKNHKDIGDYYIHCYQTVAGKMTFVNKDLVTLSAPKGSVLIEDLDAVKGLFTVRITDLDVPSGITRVEVPTWGAENGQNDLFWYQAVKEGEDYIVKVDAGKHDLENGLYHVHCYITDGNGNRTFVERTTAELALEKGVTAELTEDEKVIKAIARGIAADATSVVFPVWSEKNNQDDLKWIQAVKEGTGVWSANIPVKGHKDPGTYLVHCYQTVKGSQKFFDKTTVSVTAPSGTVAVTEPDEKTGAFEASISDLSVPAGVKQIQFAVWGNADGQNDLVWHTAVKNGDSYTAVITPGEHKFETGTYNVHCYITDQNDIFAFAGKTTAEVNLEEGVSAVVASDQNTAQVQYIGPKAGMALSVAVWSEKDGQDDLIWYKMNSNANGATATVKIPSHKTEGTYNVHVYANGNQFVGKNTFVIDPIGKASVAVSDMDGSTGTFTVTVTGLSTPSGLEKVMVPVWPNGDQSKIHWYTAARSGDSYVATVNVEKHQRAFGHYDVHVYGYANNGVWGFAGSAATELAADHYMYAEKKDTYSTRVWLLNAGEGTESVVFKAWSNTNGQDDIVEYAGVKSGTGDFYADIESKKHKNGGDYTTEAYASVADTSTLAGSVTYSMAKEGEAKNQQMFQYAQGFSSDTPYLILVNRGLHRVAIYQGSRNNWKEIQYWPCVVGKPSTPTPTGTFKIKGRFNYFGDGHLCWWCTQIEGYYYFHTVLYYTDTAPKRILDGTMDAAASAGCVRLDEPNARWIYTQIPRGTTVHIYN